jgi:hypothetical protein
LGPETIVVNWYNNNETAGIEFFAGMDPNYPNVVQPQMIGGYYESQVNVVNWLRFLGLTEAKAAAAGLPPPEVPGFLYTTWSLGADGFPGKYDDMEAVVKIIKDDGRWDEPEVEGRRLQTQIGRARILKTVTRPQTGRGRVRQTIARTQTGRARVRKTVLKQQVATARIGQTVDREQLGTACIAVTAVIPPTVTGSRGGNEALGNLIQFMAIRGDLVDETTE